MINRKSIQPSLKKIEAINNIDTPKTRRQLRRFIGMVNYYRDMWPKRAEILAPLSSMTSSKIKWKWTNEHQEAFETMKKLISKETLLTYPDFGQPFEIHTNASKIQLGACISQNNKPIAFYSRKLNPAQTRYTITERELLSIVETLKEFRTILYGQKIIVHTNHENLTYKQFNSDRVLRWRLYIEEYAPEMRYIKGPSNVVADALSRLEINPAEGLSKTEMEEKELPQTKEVLYSFLECEEKTKEDFTNYPLSYGQLYHAQMRIKNCKKYSTWKTVCIKRKVSWGRKDKEPHLL